MAKAKRLYEDLFPQTKKGAAQGLGAKRSHGKTSGQTSAPAFVTIVVERAKGRKGWSESSIKQVVLRGERIATKLLERIIEEEKFNTGKLLDVLAQIEGAENQTREYEQWLLGGPPRGGRPCREPASDRVLDTGAVYEGEGVRLLCADSLRWMDEQFDSGARFDCVLVDPPYGIDHSDIIGDEDAEKAAAEFVPRMARLVRPGRALCIWASEKKALVWVKAICREGLSVHEVIVWNKVHPWFDRRAKEVLIVAARGALQTFGDDREHVWSCKTVGDPALREMHNTPKPIETQVRALRKYTRPGDVVLDPCAGLAPVGLACIKEGRSYVGIELEERHFLNARNRLVEAVAPTPPHSERRTDFEVRRIGHAEAKPFIEQWHYSKNCPAGFSIFFGAFVDGELYAVADYGVGANMDRGASLARLTGHPVRCVNITKEVDGLTVGPLNCFELKRLCRQGEKGAAGIDLTRFLSICHKVLRREEGIRYIVSYSDPGELRTERGEDGRWRVVEEQQNSGGIYRAANFTYLGQTGPEHHDVRESDGVIFHRRNAYGEMRRWNEKHPDQPKTIAQVREERGLVPIRTPPKSRWFLVLPRHRDRQIEKGAQPLAEAA